MVAKIKTVQNINRAIYYNEHKVKEGAAECLYAGNFLKDAPQLSLLEKKQWFHQIIALNQQIGKPALHIPVSFAPGENIPRKKLTEIACEYMDRIGFGAQPYLVYYHTDTAVPHLHIVTTSIRPDGNSINLSFIGRDKSEPARKAIEEKYELVRAQKQRKAQPFDLRPLPVEKLQYGKRPTKQAITNALAYILETYKYRSIPELNAILRLYNLKADPENLVVESINTGVSCIKCSTRKDSQSASRSKPAPFTSNRAFNGCSSGFKAARRLTPLFCAR